MKEQEILEDISYTNKDFRSIYEELLKLVTKLTNKWDPMLSNESDPGVILLKLNALIGDKNNYNIDKNVLECFPLSVTQFGNARKLYDLLGYKMKYYFSATLTAYIQLIGDLKSTESISIPKWTMISDNSKKKRFVTLNSVLISKDDKDSPKPVKVIEGYIKSFETFNESGNNFIVNLNNLDSNLRLYFREKTIAQNGIFIMNESDKDINKWKLVDNIASQPSGSTVYEFGILPNSNTCYIQFPKDIAKLIDSGLIIKYIVSSGEEGNIKANTLSTFLDNITITSINEEGKSTSEVANDKLRILQPNGTKNGSNPESLKEAYNNYKRTIGSFDTLVTKRDYENYIYNLKRDDIPLVSNVIVADRTNDINFSNYIQTLVGVETSRRILKNKSSDTETITPFDIILYLLASPKEVFDELTYNATFTPDNIKAIDIQDEFFNDIKSVQHDIKLPEDKFMITNKFPISAELITYYKVTKEEQKEIEQNVKQHLIDKFNSRELTFGKEITRTNIIDSIIESDNRIKNVLLDKFEYIPQLVDINNNYIDIYNNLDLENEIVARMILSGNVQLFDFDTSFKFAFGQANGSSVGTAPDNKIESLTTETLINLESKNSHYEYDINENEVIQVLQPNLVVTNRYIWGAEYQYIGEEISANKDTTLTSELKITTKDGVDILPIGTIVNCNFALSTGGVLNTSQEIKVKEINSIDLTKGTKYYFITKKVRTSPEGNDYMQLNIPSGESYILQENEYFLYTNPTVTSIIQLGSGTKITNNGASSFNKEVLKIDLNKVNQDDINSIEWEQLLDGEDLEVIELSILNLNKGITLIADAKNESVISNTPLDITNKMYRYKNSNQTEETTINTSINPTIIQSRLRVNSTYDKPQTLLSNQKISVKLVDVEVPVEITGGTTIAFNFPVLISGGVDINMKVFLEDRLEYALTAYKYTKVDAVMNDSKIIPNKDNIIEIKDGKTWTLQYSFLGSKSEEFSYIIPIQVKLNSSSSGNALSVNASGIFPNVSLTKLTENKTYLIKVQEVDGKTNLVLTTDKKLEAGDSILIGNIIKLNGFNKNINSKTLSNNYEISTNTYTSIKSIISSIDTDKLFNWTYKVPKINEVISPINADSFWDLNHIYNRYTIPKIDFNNYTVKVHPSSVSKEF